MKSPSLHRPRLPPSWLRLFVIVLFILGIFFRFVNLDKKVYWFDEAYTSLRISGYTDAEVVKQVFNGQEISSLDLQKYQRPHLEKGVMDTIKGLALEEPQHPPLYYVLARFWAQWFGYSAATIRSLSAVLSLLVFPAIYWLCLELFESPLTGWVAIALLAVSPVHVVYAQEARQYSLWTALILLFSASLLRAIRLKTPLTWGIYAATLVLGLYTFLFSALVAIGHGIYVALKENFRWTQTLSNYLLASAISFLAFIPWIFAFTTHLSSVESTTAWATNQSTLLSLGRMAALNLRRLFFDLDFNINNKIAYLICFVLIYTFTFILSGYAIYFIVLHTPTRVWLFIMTLIGVTGLSLLLPDLILGGQLSTTTRYIIPCNLGIQLAVSHLISTQLSATFKNTWSQLLWRLILVALVSMGLLSCTVSSQSETWWNKVISYYNQPVARMINQSPQPLLISDTSMSAGSSKVGEVLSLSRLLAPNVRLQLVVQPNPPRINHQFSDIFLFTYSHVLRERVGKALKATVQPTYKERGRIWLWKLAK